MPIYEYEHIKKPCHMGKTFDINQSIHDKSLSVCPDCGGQVRKLISSCSFRSPKTNSELRNLGFTKLVKRDEGVYENVTALNGDSKIVLKDKPETLPDLSKTISD